MGKKWLPEREGRFWTIRLDSNKAEQHTWLASPGDKDLLKKNLVFRTRAKARFILRRFKKILKRGK